MSKQGKGPSKASLLVQNYISQNRPTDDQVSWDSLAGIHQEIGTGLITSFDESKAISDQLIEVAKGLGSPNPLFTAASNDLAIKTDALLKEMESIEQRHSDDKGNLKTGMVKGNNDFATVTECYHLYSELHTRMVSVTSPFVIELTSEKLRLSELEQASRAQSDASAPVEQDVSVQPVDQSNLSSEIPNAQQ